jgi:hypothetical protein
MTCCRLLTGAKVQGSTGPDLARPRIQIFFIVGCISAPKASKVCADQFEGDGRGALFVLEDKLDRFDRRSSTTKAPIDPVRASTVGGRLLLALQTQLS